jgi:hypothetical protein
MQTCSGGRIAPVGEKLGAALPRGVTTFPCRLFRESCDIGGNILGVATRECHVHPRVRGEDRERDLFRRIAVLSADSLERRRVGDLLALIRFDDVARRAVLLGLTFPIVGVGGKRALGMSANTP